MLILKLFASLVLLCCVFVGVGKADKCKHRSQYRPIAEYMTGFIFTFGGLWGLYALWG